tara:strand:- start:298 stop:564 length:267 start_codon:yes stop_codon:yes gene_type:complete
MRIVGAVSQSLCERAPQTASLDASSFWYAWQQSCPPSPYQPSRLALPLALVAAVVLLETQTFGSKKFVAYSTGPPPRMSSDAFRRKRL